MHKTLVINANTVLESFTAEDHESLDIAVIDIVSERCEKYGLMPNDILGDMVQRQSCFIQAMFRRT
jgi:hypothetical protein